MIISQTPLRISFVGGGTDLQSFYCKEEGMVLSTTIDKYVYVVVKERFDDMIYLNYTPREIVDDVAYIKHDLVRESMKKVGIQKGIEITTFADIPSEGSGLGSSSSITVGLLNALYHFAGIQVSQKQIAQEACEIEIDICKKPIGKQDQYVAAYGGLNKITFRADESVTLSKLPVYGSDLLKLGSHLLLFFTHTTRKADSILEKQKKSTEEKRKMLRKMRDFVPKLEDAIIDGKFDKLGSFLNKNWLIKKTLVNTISNPNIDLMYEIAMNNGAIGGKLCGAGGGGFLLLYVKKGNQDAVRLAMKDYRELPFMLDSYGSRMIFNVRSYSSK